MQKAIVLAIILQICVPCLSQKERVALIIGNSNYITGAPLANPENDATDLNDQLMQSGFAVSCHFDLDQTGMKKAIDEFGLKLNNADIGLFYYAGHGIQAMGRNYLVPVDAVMKTENDVEYNCVDAGRILGKMEDAGTKTNIIILDACRDNPFERSWSRKSTGSGLAFMNAPSGSLIAYSTAPGETASDGYFRNSPYTSGLLQYINTPNLKIEDFFKLVRIKVKEETNGVQVPWESTSLEGDFFFNLDPNKAELSQTTIGNMDPNLNEELIRLGSDDDAYSINEMEETRKKSASDIRSVAILPFANYTGDESQEYISAGLHDALIGELGRLGVIKVISRSSTLAYSDYQKTLLEIATELKVDGVMETSLLGSGDEIHIQLKLFSVTPEEQLIWSKAYKTDMGDIFNLYTDVVKDISYEIQLSLSSDENDRFPQKRQVNPEAYKAYLNGKFHLFKFTEESQAIALNYFQNATKIDEKYAPAYAGIAGIWIVLKQFGFVSPEEANPIIHDNVTKAVSHNNNDPDVFFWKALMDVWTDFDWEEGERSFLKCIELNPNYSEAWGYYSHFLMCLKRGEEMRETMKKAVELDPLNPTIIWLQAAVWVAQGKYDIVLEKFEPILRIDPDNPLILGLMLEVYVQTGQYDLVVEMWKRRFQTWDLGYLSEIMDKEYKKNGFKAAMEKVAAAWEEGSGFVPESEIMTLYGYAGNTEKFIFWFERSYFKNSPDLPYIPVWPPSKPFRNDPGFLDILQKLKIPEGDLG